MYENPIFVCVYKPDLILHEVLYNIFKKNQITNKNTKLTIKHYVLSISKWNFYQTRKKTIVTNSQFLSALKIFKYPLDKCNINWILKELICILVL